MNQTMEVRILEGASALFYKFGFSRVRFSEIAREVGITTRTIYNYFPNKLSLSKAVSEYTISLVLKEIRILAEADTSFSDTIYLILKQVYQELKTRLPAYRKNAEFPGRGMPDLFTVDPEIEIFITQLMNRAVLEGIFEKDAPLEMMMQLLLNQVNYCFPADGAHSAITVDEDYFIRSMLLVIGTCITDEGRKQFRQLSK
ncbi:MULTISPECIES: TetR/AcrR family transcriptional regulator [unclassified Oceanispirochaeta]|uniref:TetR/AcrR family transcriptional regulator n=1 Tax=unclassified Oceanispirochaeta TaxID=2635722 RepID=UPI000E0966A9|nr:MULTISPECIES: TetR/AcrR family transcriptional regulator [unclassified Oceanispirochaeta]MBF9018734.1 TetR/AcrR family transcriptional regulator [Oceanispirochaeta sp. M2]NPD75156.1 TetR/AcrR family transcriptional regulator [Oceanispirochaeta sp. M1]RDG28977.1 TetR/AcrR family transcriptional regulator [Oceanispirochaeta sp. M1]